MNKIDMSNFVFKIECSRQFGNFEDDTPPKVSEIEMIEKSPAAVSERFTNASILSVASKNIS